MSENHHALEPQLIGADRDTHGAWLEIRESGAGHGTVRLTLDGELDIATAQHVQARLREFRLTGTPVLLDLSKLSFVDCGGLQVLIEGAGGAGRLEISEELATPLRRLIELIRAAGLSPPSLGGGCPRPAAAEGLRPL